MKRKYLIGFFGVLAAGILSYILFFRKKESNDPDILRVRKLKKKVNINNQSSINDAVILSLILKESSGIPDKKGDAGEIGLMQVTKNAEKDTKLKFDWKKYLLNPFYSENLKNPDYNIKVGTTYLQLMFSKTKNLYDALRSYNAGYSRAMSNPDISKDYAETIMSNQYYFN